MHFNSDMSVHDRAFARPEEEALSRTCAALDESVSAILVAQGATIHRDIAQPVTPVGFDADQVKEELNELSKKETEIISYLLHHNERLFTADMDGGHAATLVSRGIVRNALRPGQVFDVTDVPMEIPRAIWNVLKTIKDRFPYSGDADDPYPWRVGFYEQL